jgi:hypothetical protein
VDNDEMSRGGLGLSALALLAAAACGGSHTSDASPDAVGADAAPDATEPDAAVDSATADTGTEDGSSACPTALTFTPSSHDFTSCDPSAPAVTFTLTNGSASATGTIAVVLGGADATHWTIESDSCTDMILAPCASCTITLRHQPTTTGAHAAELIASTSPGGTVSAALTGMCSM